MDTGPDTAAAADSGDRPGAAEGVRGEDVLAGRPDLATDSLADLRSKQRSLKTEAKRIATELRNKRRQQKRAIRRCSTLDTRDLVQVLLDRRAQLQREKEAASSAASSGQPQQREEVATGAGEALPEHAEQRVADDALAIKPQ